MAHLPCDHEGSLVLYGYFMGINKRFFGKLSIITIFISLHCLGWPVSTKVAFAASDDSSPRRKIIAAVPVDFPPTYSRNKTTGRAEGFAVDILDEIAKNTDIDVSYVFGKAWDEIHQMVVDGKADIIPSLTISDDRMKVFLFSSPVETVPINYIVRSQDKKTNSIKSGMTVGVMRGSSADSYLSNRKDITVTEFDSLQTLLFELLAGHLDITLTVSPNIKKLAYDIGIDDKITVIDPPVVDGKRGMAINKNNNKLYEIIEKGVNDLVGTERYKEIYEKWWGKPKPFWTIKKVILISIGISILSIFTILIIYARSITKLNGKLKLAISKINEERIKLKNTLDELHNSENRFSELFNYIADPIYISNMHGLIIAANDQACKMLGYTNDEIVTCYVHDIDAVSNKPEKVVKQLSDFNYDSLAKFESVHQRKDGSRFPVEVHARHIIFGNQPAIMGVARDVSEIKRAENERIILEKQLSLSQKMESLGILAGGIAHDFNNILGAVLGYAEMALEDSPSDSFVARNLTQVIAAGNRAKELVKQILAFSRQSKSNLEPLQPSLLIKEALKLLRPSLPATITIEQDIDADSHRILADATQFHQIVMNLCTNAYHAMEEKGGTLSISLKNQTFSPLDFVNSNEVRFGNFVQLTIRDTGPGISPEIQDKIFEPYYTTKEVGKGSGMGLAIVHGIVKGYDGFLTCESEIGKGTIFTVTLPALGKQIEMTTLPKEISPAGTERILLVDDEQMLVEMGQAMLERLGYTVTIHTDSREALSTFSNRPNDFDLVITDQTMPIMTGMDIAQRMLLIRPDLPVILSTGYSSIIDKDKARACGIKGFASKPLTKNDLAVLVRNVLDGKSEKITDDNLPLLS